MGAKAYPIARQAEAVALAAIVGADAAGKQLGIQPRTIRGWAEKAGKAPADAIARTDWAALAEAARARVASDLGSGKLSTVQVATVAAIADRNVREDPKASPESAVAARGAFWDWVCELPEVLYRPLDADDDELHAALDELPHELLRRANAELPRDRPAAEHNAGRRGPMLAWFSNREEVPAGDLLEWAQAQVRAILDQHGDFIAFAAWAQAQREAEHDATVAQLERNRQRLTEETTRRLDESTRALLAEAEAWLQEHAE